MNNELKFYINGSWIEPNSVEQIEVLNPATEEVLGNITAGSKEDVDIAVKAATNAFQTYSIFSKDEKITIFESIIKEYEARLPEMAEIISDEMGAPMWLSNVAQAASGLGHFKTTLNYLKSFEFETDDDGFTLRKEPIGVVGMITPWNWPINQVSTKVASALAAGCTMVLKPSEISPFCAMLLAEILDSSSLPKGVFNLVNGYGPIVGAALSEHRSIDMMSFTGSTRAGIAVAQASAKNVKRVSQELGGKSANIILDDANIEKAVAAGVSHCFLNSGQSCNAPTRMLVSEKNYDLAVSVAKEVAEKTTVGDPKDENTRIGPISNKTQYEKILRLIQIGIDEGALLVTGGVERPENLDKGYYVKPTVFANVTNDMTIAKEEIFGPVICLIKYSSEEEAIEIANDTEYGLAGYVQGEISHATEVARQIRAGQITINGGNRENAAPFGGYKMSGNGREHGRIGLEEFLETKAIIAPL
jgi:aldehyde dehydrogenase (NAD+)